jgi:hypothetical protein
MLRSVGILGVCLDLLAYRDKVVSVFDA